MKLARLLIVLGTLAMAGLAGTNDRDLRSAASCGLDGVAALVSGTPGGTCSR